MQRDEPPEPLEPDIDREADDPAVDDLDPREGARIHRRDHDAEAHRRELMRPGMGKVFKQITDSWGEKAVPDQKHARKSTRHDS